VGAFGKLQEVEMIDSGFVSTLFIEERF